MKLKVETPPNLTGTSEQQLRQMHSYLFRMVEGLNVALGNLSETKPQESGSGNAYNELRALIGNTAESVKELRKEIDKENGETATIDPLQLMPVGYIYISSDPTSPAELFGGTWEALTDRVIVGAGGKYDVNSTGGSATVSHRHRQTIGYDGSDIYAALGVEQTSSIVAQNVNRGFITATHSSDTATRYDDTFDTAISVMQPYVAKYIWERTA